MIRSASINDIETIQSLAARVWPIAYANILSTGQLNYMLEQFYSKESLKEQLMTKGHQFFVMENEAAEAIGFASVSHEGGHCFKLQKLYVLSKEQGKNYGKQLTLKVVDYAREKGGKILKLNVNRYNKAQFFYTKLGFKIVEEVDIAIGNNYFMNDFVMELNL